MEDVPWKKQTLTKDWRQPIGILAGAHGAKQDDLGIRLETLGQVQRGLLQRENGGRRTLGVLGITLEITGDNPGIGGDQPIRHRDDMHAVILLARPGERPSVFELASKIEAAEKAEDIPQWNALLTQPASEGNRGPRPPQCHRPRTVSARRRDQKDPWSLRQGRHGETMRNFGARDTFPPVQIRLLPAAIAALAVASACVQPPPFETTAPAVNTPQVDVASDSAARVHLIDIRLVDPTIMVEAKYATTENFTGAPLPGYESNRALLRREAAAALARVQRRARSEGFALKVYDGYRPARATLAMVEWANRTGQQRLLRDGYIASRSRHNLGLAVDLTLIGGDGQELDMGTPFDTFSAAAHTVNATGEVASNRTLLVRLMQAEGFTNYDKEWWHFSYEVPDPLRFDLVIR